MTADAWLGPYRVRAYNGPALEATVNILADAPDDAAIAADSWLADQGIKHDRLEIEPHPAAVARMGDQS
jgi:hypothetical protein